MVEDRTVHHLDGGRIVSQDRRGLAERVEQVVVLDGQHRLGLRQRHQVETRFEDEAERALGADDQLRQVERRSGLSVVRRGERVEVVAAHPAQDLRVPPVDLLHVPGGRLADGTVAGALEGVRRAGCFQLPGRERTQVRDRAVGQRDVQVEHVIDGLAVAHRPRAARVVRDHPADGGAAGRGDVGREPQAVGRELRVQLVEHDARLHARPALLDVHFEDPVEVLRGVDLQSGPDCLAGLRRAAAAGGDGAAVGAGALQRGQYVLARADDGHPERLDLVDAGVGGVQRARHRVEADLADEPRFEIGPEVTHAAQYKSRPGAAPSRSSPRDRRGIDQAAGPPGR